MKIWAAAVTLLTGLFLVFNFVYRSGAEGLQISGAEVGFGRGHDSQLYRVAEDLAIVVSASNANASELSVVETTDVVFPFSMLCGAHAMDGFATDHQRVRSASALEGRSISIEPHPIPGQRDRVTVAMTPIEAHQHLQPMSTCNESCVTFNVAFVVLFALALLTFPVVLLAGRKRQRRATEG